MFNQNTRLSIFLCVSLVITFFIVLLSGCVSNTLLLETKVNDPIMMNLLDNYADLTQIEDGTGFIGEATSCPT